MGDNSRLCADDNYSGEEKLTQAGERENNCQSKDLECARGMQFAPKEKGWPMR